MEHWRKSAGAFWAGFLPPTLWLLAFFFVPLSLIWAFSFGEKSGIIDIDLVWTFENYARALEPLYLGIFAKSLWMATITTFICLLVGFPVAIGIVFAPPKMRMWLLLLVILPFWTNLLIRTYALIAVLRTRGHVNFALEWMWDHANSFLTLIGLGSFSLLGERFEPLQMLYNNTAVVIGLVYVGLPFMVLPLYAALDRLDRSYIEASLDLGAGHIRTFWSVVVPLALPGIASGIVITFIPTLGSFLTPDLLGGPDSQMIANVIERQFKSANHWPFGSALSFLLMYATFFGLAVRALMSRNEQRGIR
ncbi:binding-protein-dependent transport systems inner membrane component [Tepidicaulis marinus]|jgi:spermidine/putrescine transport system permease protein|uniref:Binding-protein-dependent transport systems inner membrane component n=1 Tax=Tepidicaulis marinus TaxID=1333998 RepID=A0A081B8N4_9HYPH|nr:ABC transporter permease [Tepidicaulis marinus]GAK44402.1 binding-protein-dependent transport systems inner membrane component [Tepidicaulis marinus]